MTCFIETQFFGEQKRVLKGMLKKGHIIKGKKFEKMVAIVNRIYALAHKGTIV